MKFHYTNLETCHEATGMVVVVDVLRAFSNAAYAFARGAKEIYPIANVDEALKFKSETPYSLAAGEVGGLQPEGFDLGNSPTQTKDMDLSGKVIVQSTGAGTKGIVRSVKAETMLAASFVVASATTQFIRKLEPEVVTFVITGQYRPGHGDEDLACAEYLEALFNGQKPDPQPFINRVFDSRDAIQHLDPNQTAFPLSDLDLCTHIDAFDFAMLVSKENGRHVMRAIKP
ncbi:MAG: 2-phosphosulfolactate phosphatase [Anaerolineales bacterium]|nr:2-phosphosulfolactate phosphatase [Anaerolineales bacterium]